MFSIMTNPTAIGAQSAVNNSNNSLSKTIQQLSTGLRINSSADDASGMAVSEKLRGQISGLKVAARNAQDGISFLQTAEANMGTMTSMVQRIRELAVQAGDPAYTSSDRVMLQTEVDQLKQEINRVSSSAEFNTKKLLNGDAAALWSSTGNGLDAIVKGSTVEGNYKLDITSSGGANAVYKTNVMSVANAANNIAAIDSAAQTAFDGVNITRIQQTGMIAATSAGDTAPRVGLGVAATAGGAAAIGIGIGIRIGGTNATFGVNATAGTANAATASGYYEIEAITAKATAADSGTFRIRFVNAATGAANAWVENLTVQANGNVAAITAAQLGGNGAASFIANAFTFGATFGVNDKAVVAVSVAAAASTVPGDANVTINTGGADAAGAATTGITIRVAGLYNANSDVSKTVTTAQWDDKLQAVVYGKLTLSTKAAPFTDRDLTTAAGALNVGSKTASGWNSLGELESFINADGRNVLANTQELTMYGNGTQTKITLESKDSIADFLDKMRAAITELGMDGGVDPKQLVQFVSSPGTGNLATPGTIVFQGGIMGKNSEISFSGNQGVIDGLGVAQIKQAEDATVTVKVTDAHTGRSVGRDTVGDGVLRDIIKNVDIVIDQKGLAAGAMANGNITFTPRTGVTSYLHLVNNATVAAIGANEGQTLDISIGRMDTVSLGIDSVNVLTIGAAQKAITQLDQSLDTINKGRAIIGAQMNRLNYTINNLNVSRENMMAAESRIRDLDIAEASTNLAAQQVRLQAATAMLAQANQLPSYAAQLLR